MSWRNDKVSFYYNNTIHKHTVNKKNQEVLKQFQVLQHHTYLLLENRPKESLDKNNDSNYQSG